MASYELKTNTPVTREAAPAISAVQDRDNANLQRLGKKPVLKVCINKKTIWSDY